MYRFGSFHLRDMTACGAVLRRLGEDAANLEVVAERLVRYLYTSFTTAQTDSPACLLVRLFKTTPYSRLTPDLQRLATTRLRNLPPYPSLTCLTLLASAGVIPGWNDPACSSRFRLIPLGGPDDLAQLPMFSRLFHQLNWSQPQAAESGHNLLLDSQEHLFNVFHVLRAEGSPYIPAQEEFVLRYGVRSVLGFGAPLPNGDIFSVILFSTQIIPEATAQLFKPLALCAQIALAPHAETGHSPCAPELHSATKGTHDTDPTLPQLQERIAQLENLLAVHEQTVNIQANRTETIVSGAGIGTWEWDIPSGYATFNHPTGVERWSDECCRIFGLDPAQATPNYDLFIAALHPEDRSRVQEAVNASLQHHDTPYNLECRIIRPTGEIRHIHCRGVVHRDTEGRPLTMAGTVLDMTDYKRSESALRASEEKVRSVLDNAIDGIIVIDDHGRIESVNPAALTLLSYDEQDLSGQNVTMLMPSSYREQHDRFLATHPVTGNRSIIESARDVQALRKDGTVIDVHVSASDILIGHSRKYTVMLRDISERKRMGNALLESEERFRQLATHIDAIFWLTSADKHRILYVSPAFQTIWGRSCDELYANPMLWIECIHPEDRDRVAIAAACQSYLPYDEEYRIVTSAGTVRWIRDRGFPVKDEQGTVYRLAGIAVDITDAKRMEDAVRASEMRYRSLVELSPSAVFVNCDGRMAFANQACAILLGAPTPHDLIGRRVFDFIHPDSQPLVQERMRAMRETGEIAPRIDEQFCRLDGTVIAVEVAAARVPFEGKEAFLVIVTDVSARKRLEQALLSANRQLTAILEGATNVSIVATDRDGVITTFNSGAEALLGYSSEEMVGLRSLASLHLPHQLDERGRQVSELRARPISGFEALIEPAQDGKLDEQEWIYVRKDGRRLTVLLTVTALRNDAGALIGFLAMGKDITERKQAEVTLAHAAHEMESKNKELAKARDEALQAVHLKADFLATMSHEIRTPMNAIIGMTGLLLDTALTAEQHEFADTVRRSSDSLLTLVNDILDFSKIEAGKLQFETLTFDLRTMVEDTLELLAEQAQSKGLELIGSVDAAVPAAVVGDPGRLRQILVNLIGNAIKFTTTGEVFLHVTCDRDAGADYLRFTIKDTGIGIPEAAQTRLFQAFSQADSSTTRRYGGTGLGLAICRRLVHQMQGRIGIDSRPGQGSTFWFTGHLPETTLNVTPAPLSPSQLRGRRILLVNPNRTARHALHQQLVAYGMDCVGAHNGADACETVRGAVANQKPFDLALIELHLPDMDGLETAKKLKSDPTTAAMRTVILTTMGRRGDGSAAQAIGIDAYLTKPLRQSQLLHCLCRLVGDAASLTATEQASATPLITRHTLAETRTSPIIRLLLAEDNPVNQKVACKMLEKLGCRVDVVGNGQEAVAAHERAPYPLIFMDCQMPEMDGFEATAMIRNREASDERRDTNDEIRRTHRVPIVAMTANAMKGDREKCLAAGMDDYVAKPIRPKDLQAILDAWLPKRTETAA